MSVAPADEPQPGFQPQIRLGSPVRVRGGASVSLSESAAAAEAGAQWQPLTQIVGQDALAAAGLFEPRVFDIAQRGEELVIAKGLHVREELLVTRSSAARTEQIAARVRRAEAEIEPLRPGETEAAQAD